MLKLEFANEYLPFFKITNKLNILFNNLTYKIYQPYTISVDYFKINNNLLGYMGHQTPGEFESNPSLILKNKKIWQNVKCIFFIPSKQRVYLEYLDQETKNKKLRSEYAYNLLLNQFKGAKVIDLTPTLQNEAKFLSAKNEYVYFIDDTHWNKNGINAVLPTINNCLND